MTTKAKITLYPSEETKERLEALCERERRSVNAQVLLWIEDKLDAEDRIEIPRILPNQIPVLQEAAPKKQRLVTCPHRLGPDQFCKECDA